jgi:hypothetical protein
MIAQPRRARRCFQCGHLATRSALIDGLTEALCGDCPSPDEIRQRCDDVRSTWPSWRVKQGYAQERHGNLAADEPRHVARLAPTDQDR